MSDAYLGEIRLFGFGAAPDGWALCEGQVLDIAQHDGLFKLLGTANVQRYRKADNPVDMHPQSIGVTGGGQGHENMMPYLAVNYVIALEGTFPPRN